MGVGIALVQTCSNPLLKKLTEGAKATETGSLFQYLTTLSSGDGKNVRGLGCD